MKKLFAITLALLMMLSLGSCGGSEGGEVEQEVKEETIVLTGSGNQTLQVGSIEDGYVFHITGNEAEEMFSVIGGDENGNLTTMLVLTEKNYDGITADMSLKTTQLEISAVGDWTVELVPINNLPRYKAGETVTGDKDTVFWTSDIGSYAVISGNEAGGLLIVNAYGDEKSEQLLSTTEPFNGKVDITCSPFVMTVMASNEFSIELH